MKAIIVDDDKNSHIVLKNLIQQQFSEINIVGNGFGVQEGIQLINEYQPDLLFLDIEMPDGTGFDLLNSIETPQFHLVFVTGFNQYAQTAIRFGALDYLLKPISSKDLETALLRVQIKRLERIQFAQMEIIRDTLLRLEKKELPQKMSISTAKGVLYFRTQDVIRLEAMQNFTEFIVKNDDRRLIASHNLKKFEQDLKPFNSFMRVHRSHIVNVNEVLRLKKGDKYYLEMMDKKIVPVSKKIHQNLLIALNEVSL